MISKLNREGSMISRSENTLSKTAVSMVAPCNKYLCFRFRLKLTRSNTRRAIWTIMLACGGISGFISLVQLPVCIDLSIKSFHFNLSLSTMLKCRFTVNLKSGF